MPILAENKHRYPASWRGIREAILERAGNRCEQCGIPNNVWRNKVRWNDKLAIIYIRRIYGYRAG